MTGIGGTRVDFWRNSLAEQAFIGGAEQAALAANNSLTQLFNPAESGKLLICTKIHVAVSGLSNIEFFRHNAVLTIGPIACGNKYIAEPQPIGTVHSDNNVGALGTHIAFMGVFQATVRYTMSFEHDPWIIGAGLGLVVYSSALNVGLDTAFEWLEK